MKPHLALFIAGAILGVAPAWAQFAPPPQPGPPSVQPLTSPQPNPALPIGASLLPGTPQPVQPVEPQLQLRFGKVPPVSASVTQSALTAETAALNRIEDKAARCDALADDPQRSACRSELAHARKVRAAALAASAASAAAVSRAVPQRQGL